MLIEGTPDIQLKGKQDQQYAVKNFFDVDTKADAEEFATVQDVDTAKREVKFVINTPNFLDSDLDVILPGAANRSIKDRGPESKSTAMIKNFKDHDSRMVPGKVKYIAEEDITVRGRTFKALVMISKMFSNDLGQNQLIQYQEGGIDNHSIGFIYDDIKLVERKAPNQNKEWDQVVEQSLNPKAFDDKSYFFLVKSIKLFEGSSVAFGANELTPYLGVKSGNPVSLKMKLQQRISNLTKALSKGVENEETMFDIEIECRMLNQMIEELTPSFKMKDPMKEALLREKGQKRLDLSSMAKSFSL